MADEKKLTHLDADGRARMVDVTAKPWTRRIAVARGRVVATSGAMAAVTDLDAVFDRARVAGIGAAKIAWDLIPLCHPIRLVGVTVDLVADDDAVEIEASTEVFAPTGVEMEALTACSVAGLVVVQELRRHDPAVRLTGVALWRKEGGRSGTWTRDDARG